MPVVICLVGTGVVLKGIDASGADASDRAPVQIPEVDDEIGGDTVHRPIQLLWAKSARPKITSMWVADRRDLVDQLLADALILGRRDSALRLTSLHIEEQPPVVAAITPRF